MPIYHTTSHAILYTQKDVNIFYDKSSPTNKKLYYICKLKIYLRRDAFRALSFINLLTPEDNEKSIFDNAYDGDWHCHHQCTDL